MHVRNVLFIVVALTCAKTVPAGAAQNIKIIADVGFSTPESVEYYAAKDAYLVTNINGSPFARDGNGFISKLNPAGDVIDLKWIDGAKKGITLNSPKGAAIVGKNLYVADLNQVQVFALPSGKQKKSITIKGSTFLNGITPGAGNYVYVTDSGYHEGFTPSGTDAVYQVWPTGKYKAIVKDDSMGHPNGILEEKGHLIINTFGSGRMIDVDKSGKQTEMPTPPKGGLDGLIKAQNGEIIVSSWGGSAIYALNKDNKYSVVADSLDAPADLGFDTKRNRILVPLFKLNKVAILPH